MSKLLRYHQDADICFVTSVTNLRARILADNAELLIDAMRHHADSNGFAIIAYAILPDHWHALIECRGNDLSEIMRKIKLSFSKQFRYRLGTTRGHIWQKRFWDHIVRDQDDMNRHVDYIHYNPVKHGLVTNLRDWPFSTFHRYCRAGYYNDDWGRREVKFTGEFGE